MRIEELLNHTGEWLRGTGPSAHIVMSSRVRLARNLADWTFPGKSTKKDLEAVLTAVGEAVGRISELKGSTLFGMIALDQVDRQMLALTATFSFVPDSMAKNLLNRTMESAIQSAIGVTIYSALVYSQRY